MSGGQQGGPMMGGSGKGGAQAPQGGGKGGPQAPQGHMMPNGQRQTRPGGPPPGWSRPQIQPGQGFGQYMQELGGMGQPTPQTYPGQQMMQQSNPALGSVGQQMGVPGQQPAQFQHQMAAMNNGTPGPQYQPQQQPRQLSGLLAKLYGG